MASEQPPSSQVPEGQAAQLAPEVPQLLGELPAWQTPMESQQPPSQLFTSHSAATQTFILQVPVPQLWQVMPFFPHAVTLLPPRQTPPWQQPGQLAGPQALSHAWPVQVTVH